MQIFINIVTIFTFLFNFLCFVLFGSGLFFVLLFENLRIRINSWMQDTMMLDVVFIKKHISLRAWNNESFGLTFTYRYKSKSWFTWKNIIPQYNTQYFICDLNRIVDYLMQRCSLHQLKRWGVNTDLINVNRLIQLFLFPGFDLNTPIQYNQGQDVTASDWQRTDSFKTDVLIVAVCLNCSGNKSVHHPTSSGVMFSTTGGAAGLYRERNER